MVNEPFVNAPRRIILRDSTLREGLDTPNVAFTTAQKIRIARLLDKANVPEIEIVAPAKVLEDKAFAVKLKQEGLPIVTSGLIYSFSPQCHKEIVEMRECLNRIDLLMPVSERRRPYDRNTKKRMLQDALDYSLQHHSDIGVGFPQSTQADPEFLLEISQECVEKGAKRVMVYDTNGSSDPFTVYNLIKRLRENLDAQLFFHGHNDLGLATANSLAAVYAGADGLDTTVNGLGDRAGNASLEQVAVALYVKGFHTGISLKSLRRLVETVERESGVKVSRLAPIVGAYVHIHQSPAHLESPDLFEAFDPSLVG
jgi:homocitrate synthase NifV